MPAAVRIATTPPALGAAEVQSWFDLEVPVAVIDTRLMNLVEGRQRPDPDAVCEVLAVLDQNHRRRRLTSEEFKRLKGRIERHVLSQPAVREPAARVAAQSNPTVAVVPMPALPVATVVLAPPAALLTPSPVKDEITAAGVGVGAVLRGRYTLKELIGEGGMSCVFLASDKQRESIPGLARHVAVKILRSSLGNRSDALQCLQLEFERAQRLSHQAIVRVFDLDTDGDVHFITMELLRGELLSDVIKRLRPGTLSRAQAWEIIARLGDAVVHAHEMGVIHADLKPGNVMLTEGGELRLFDFGAAWIAQTEPWIYESSGRSLQGATPAYASPERLTGSAPTLRDDVFSFSCLAYELLSGEHPFGRRPANHAQDAGMKPKRVAGLTGGQWQALKRGLSFEREHRFPQLQTLLRQLKFPESGGRSALLRLNASEPAQGSNRVSGLMLVLLGTGAFAVVHVMNAGAAFADIPAVAAIKPWFAAAVQWLNSHIPGLA